MQVSSNVHKYLVLNGALISSAVPKGLERRLTDHNTSHRLGSRRETLLLQPPS